MTAQPHPIEGAVERLRWEDLIEMTDEQALAAIDANIAARTALSPNPEAGG